MNCAYKTLDGKCFREEGHCRAAGCQHRPMPTRFFLGWGYKFTMCGKLTVTATQAFIPPPGFDFLQMQVVTPFNSPEWRTVNGELKVVVPDLHRRLAEEASFTDFFNEVKKRARYVFKAGRRIKEDTFELLANRRGVEIMLLRDWFNGVAMKHHRGVEFWEVDASAIPNNCRLCYFHELPVGKPRKRGEERCLS